MSRPLPAPLASWLESLACPRCHRPLEIADRTLRCTERHSFDVARAGYVSLLTGAPATSGDDDDMARARDSFLATGAYGPLRDVIADLAPSSARRILDIGGGTGHYLTQILTELPDAVGLTTDVSKFAARKAARAHPRSGAITADSWRRLPLADNTADALLNVFATSPNPAPPSASWKWTPTRTSASPRA